MPHALLVYTLAPDYLARRGEFRGAHLNLARAAFDRGELVLAGALADPADEALLVFTTDLAARAFAESDPYVREGLAKAWRVRTWNTVVGEGATPPDPGLEPPAPRTA